MAFASHPKQPTRRYGSYALVALIHVGLVYVMVQGLKNPASIKFHPGPIVDITPTTPVEQPKPEWKKLTTTDIKLPTPPIDIDIPPISVQPKLTEGPVLPTGPTEVKPGPGTVITDSGPGTVEPPTYKAGQGTDPGVSCKNYGVIRGWLSDRFPVIADREGFADRGISHFDMTVQFTVGPTGEVRDLMVRDSSNAVASRAMQSTVLAGMRQLKCAGQGRDVSMSVPLSFTLTD